MLQDQVDEFRHRRAMEALEMDKDQTYKELFGEAAHDRLPLQIVREQAQSRNVLEQRHVKERNHELESELEVERKARREAERKLAQVSAKLASLEATKGKHMTARVDAELRLTKEIEKRERIADNKRELEERFNRLLLAYQELVEGYDKLKKKFLFVKEMKTKTSYEKFKYSLHKVKELFTQEEVVDPDKLPSLSGALASNITNNSNSSLDRRGELEEHRVGLYEKRKGSDDDIASSESKTAGRCDFCGDDGICMGFKPSPLNELFCRCGHEKSMHDFDNDEQQFVDKEE